VLVQGDPRLLRVLLENLLGNAWKFTSKHPCAHITFGVAEREDQPVYFVCDDGVGFDMAYSKKLFGAFQRLHAISEFDGTGIGLATVKRIVQRHGGQVWAEGAVDQGATFSFTLGYGGYNGAEDHPVGRG
jgi:light-regulated signal transduction histidine kinase (bacteriophytochrome)